MKLKMLFIGLIISALVICNTSRNQEKKKDVETQKVEISKNTVQNFVIGNKVVGDFKVGGEIVFPTENDTYKVEKKVLTKMIEGYEEEETVYSVSENNERLLLLEVSYDRKTGDATKNIKEILVYSDKFKTSKGIGVSSTIDEFITAYPVYKIWYEYIRDIYFIETDSIDALFILDEMDFTTKINVSGEQTPLNKSDFKSTAKIVGVQMDIY